VFLVGRTAVMGQRKFFANRPFAIVWLGFLALAVATFALLWVLVSALHGAFIDLRPFAFQAVLTVACYPAASYLLARAQRAFLAQA